MYRKEGSATVENVHDRSYTVPSLSGRGKYECLMLMKR